MSELIQLISKLPIDILALTFFILTTIGSIFWINRVERQLGEISKMKDMLQLHGLGVDNLRRQYRNLKDDVEDQHRNYSNVALDFMGLKKDIEYIKESLGKALEKLNLV